MLDEDNLPLEDAVESRGDDAAALSSGPLMGDEESLPPTRAEFLRLAAEVRRLAEQIAHGRA